MPTRPSTVRLSAAGFSPWILLNRLIASFGVGLGAKMSSNGNLTYSVQHTFDDLYERTAVQLSRVTTSLTITKTNHGLSTNDWVQLTGTPIWDGTYSVASVTDQNNFVVTVANSGVTSGSGYVQTGRIFEHDSITAKTASEDGNYAFPPKACRLLISAYTAGYVDLTVIQGGK